MENKRMVVGLGEALWDVLPEGKKIGGAPANFAYHVSQFGLDSVAISALGNDALGNEIVEILDEKKMNHLMSRVDYPTGTVQVQLDANGIPTYDIKVGAAWDNIPLTDEMLAIAKTAKAVCWGSLAQRNEVSRQTIKSFVTATPADCLRIFDINLRQSFYTREVIEESMRLCNVLKINDEELVVLEGMLALQGTDAEQKARKLMAQYGLDYLVLTCGTDGSYVFTANESSFVPTPKVKVGDTVGAGDSFTGAFCASILSGLPVKEAHQTAVGVSAFVCTQKGAMPVLPAEYVEKVKR